MPCSKFQWLSGCLPPERLEICLNYIPLINRRSERKTTAGSLSPQRRKRAAPASPDNGDASVSTMTSESQDQATDETAEYETAEFVQNASNVTVLVKLWVEVRTRRCCHRYHVSVFLNYRMDLITSNSDYERHRATLGKETFFWHRIPQ